MSVHSVPPIYYLADLAGSYTLENVPAAVRRQAVLCILDTVGCTIAGTVAEEARLALKAEVAIAGAVEGKNSSTVVGSSIRLPLTSAARVNAFAGDQFELNDLLGGHASIGCVNATLALAERLNSKGSDLVLATVAALEVTTKLFTSYYWKLKPYSESLLVPVALPSSVGAAAGCGRLLGLTSEQLRNSCAIAAGTTTCCPAEIIFRNGGSAKPLLFGALPAETAIQAAFVAQTGLAGPPHILEGEYGFFSTASTGVDYEKLYTKEWALSLVTRHSSLDGIAQLRKESGSHWPPVKIHVGVNNTVNNTVGAKTSPPTTSNEARFHSPYLMAVIVSSEDPIEYILPEHSLDFEKYLSNPLVGDLMKNVTFSREFDDTTFYHTSNVTVTFADGSTKSVLTTAPRGSAKNQLDEAGVIAKFDALAIPVAGKERAERIRHCILSLESSEQLDELFTLLGANW